MLTAFRRWVAALSMILMMLVVVPLTSCGAMTPTVEAPVGSAGATVDPDSGLPIITEDQLPAEAIDTLALIDAGGPFPYDQDGETFFNREGVLPDEGDGFYREYTVETPGEDDRGARRIVTGDQDTIYYYTSDHYDSFSRIAR